MTKILVIGDCHVDDDQDLSRFSLASRLIVDTMPQHIVIIGDFLTLNCLSRWDKDKRQRMEGKRYHKEIEAGNEALDILFSGMVLHNDKCKLFKKKLYQPDIVYIEGNHCLSENHEILTASGWKNYNEISVGDYILTMGVNGVGEWYPIDDIIVRDNDSGYLHSNTNPQVSLECTNGHRIYFKTNNKDRVEVASRSPNSMDVPVSVKGSKSQSVNIEDDWIRLAGWMCTDSYFNNCGCVFLYQSEGKDHIVRDLLDRLGLEYTEKPRNRLITHICGKELKSVKINYEFKLSKDSSKKVINKTEVNNNKGLPKWALFCSDNQWDVLLDTLITADGSDYKKERGSCCVFYGKEPICSDVQAAAVAHGWRASLREYRDSQYRVNLSRKSHIRMNNVRTNTIPYNGKVWCVSVKNNNFITRCNGNVHITGNCDRLTRYMEYDPTFHGHVSIEKDLHLSDRGITWVPYRKYHNINDISFTHIPHNKVNPVSGVDICRKVSQVTVNSIVFGHTHSLNIANFHKEGQNHLQQILNVGCFLSKKEDYVAGRMTDYWRGLVMLDSWKPGRFDIELFSLGRLERMYD